MDENTKRALSMLSQYTRGRFSLWSLTGHGNAPYRAALMSMLKTGRVGQVPQSKSGITALEAEFYQRAHITGGCGAEQEENFIAWAKAQSEGGS